MSFKISPTQTPNSTSFSVFTTKKILSHFHKQNITMLANKINKVVPFGVIHLGSNPHQLTNHIIPNRIMRYRCDYVKNQKVTTPSYVEISSISASIHFSKKNYILMLTFC